MVIIVNAIMAFELLISYILKYHVPLQFNFLVPAQKKIKRLSACMRNSLADNIVVCHANSLK
jgi:hypothetical protein